MQIAMNNWSYLFDSLSFSIQIDHNGLQRAPTMNCRKMTTSKLQSESSDIISEDCIQECAPLYLKLGTARQPGQHFLCRVNYINVAGKLEQNQKNCSKSFSINRYKKSLHIRTLLITDTARDFHSAYGTMSMSLIPHTYLEGAW